MKPMSELARAAAKDTHTRFGHRLLHLPGTWIGRPYSLRIRMHDGSLLSDINGFSHPFAEWNYWWQAHYLDAIIDDGLAYWDAGDRAEAQRELRRAKNLLFGIRLRNFGVFPNYFFDDMAWLALASQRLVTFSRKLEGRSHRGAKQSVSTLRKQLQSGIDDVLDGGLYWSRKRDFKNTPANAPAALFFARSGDRAQARKLLEWMKSRLFSEQHGLYLDGLRLTSTGHRLEDALYTYNQGPVLGALLELGTNADLEHAAVLIRATRRHLADETGILSLNGGGDGNLFAGILCRYLALCANDDRIDLEARGIARELVLLTARSLIDEEPRRLSAAIQRWMIFSAAQKCDSNDKF